MNCLNCYMRLFLFLLGAKVALAVELVLDKEGDNYRELPISTRIIGGSQVSAGEYPWFARPTILNGLWQGCGGMLVAPEFVLTAVHCIDTAFVNYGRYKIGALCAPYKNGDNCGQAIETFKVKTVYKHPSFKTNTLNFDFALVKLDGSATIKPVEMDQGDYSPKYSKDEVLWTVGFGNTSTDSEVYSSRLRDVKVNYVPNWLCKNSYEDDSITFQMMCAAASGRDSCQGDSGGPLYDKTNKVVVGIVSWGVGCADPDFPGVYARVSSQWNWIQRTICDNHTASTAPKFCGNSSNYYPNSSSTPNGPLIIKLKPDRYSKNENSWILKMQNSDGKFIIIKQRASLSFKNNKLQVNKFTYPSKSCFRFEMKDSYGDGLLGAAYFSITWKGELIIKSKMIGKKSQSIQFGSCGRRIR